MSSEEVIELAKALPPATHPWTEDGELTALRTLAALATVKSKQATIKSLLSSAEAYRPADFPGHSTWYDYYVRAAAWAVQRWGHM